MKKIVLCFLSAFSMSCTDFIDNSSSLSFTKNEGYVPESIVNEASLKQFKIVGPQDLQNPSKSYIEERYLFISEYGRGVHVFDNQDVKNPKSLFFIEIPALTDFFVQGNTLVSDNGNDLVAFNIRGVEQVAVFGKKVEQVASDRTLFSLINTQLSVFNYPNYPMQRNVYFQCADTVGYVTQWKLDTASTGYTCYR